VLSGISNRLNAYPGQFWILFFGQLVSAVGMSLIWPFMTIYVREKLDVTLTVVGLVLAANSIADLLSQLVGGCAIRDSDRPELATEAFETVPANNPRPSSVEKRCSRIELSLK
jgi:hypothetical protein